MDRYRQLDDPCQFDNQCRSDLVCSDNMVCCEERDGCNQDINIPQGFVDSRGLGFDSDLDLGFRDIPIVEESELDVRDAGFVDRIRRSVVRLFDGSDDEPGQVNFNIQPDVLENDEILCNAQDSLHTNTGYSFYFQSEEYSAFNLDKFGDYQYNFDFQIDDLTSRGVLDLEEREVRFEVDPENPFEILGRDNIYLFDFDLENSVDVRGFFFKIEDGVDLGGTLLLLKEDNGYSHSLCLANGNSCWTGNFEIGGSNYRILIDQDAETISFFDVERNTFVFEDNNPGIIKVRDIYPKVLYFTRDLIFDVGNCGVGSYIGQDNPVQEDEDDSGNGGSGGSNRRPRERNNCASAGGVVCDTTTNCVGSTRVNNIVVDSGEICCALGCGVEILNPVSGNVEVDIETKCENGFKDIYTCEQNKVDYYMTACGPPRTEPCESITNTNQKLPFFSLVSFVILISLLFVYYLRKNN